jgi:hypothetical protein
VAYEVPARKLKAANLSQHFFSIHRLEVFFLGLVRNRSKSDLPSQADLIAGIDDGICPDSRGVGQIPKSHIGSSPDDGVEAARRSSMKAEVAATRDLLAPLSIARFERLEE